MSTFDEAALISELSGADCHIEPLSRGEQPHDQTICSHLIPLEHKFLVLAPVTSDSYPAGAQPNELPAPAVSSAAPTAVTAAKSTPDVQPFQVEPVQKERRSSSVSSVASGKLRFLKLGPVHFGGEHGQADFVEVDEE